MERKINPGQGINPDRGRILDGRKAPHPQRRGRIIPDEQRLGAYKLLPIALDVATRRDEVIDTVLLGCVGEMDALVNSAFTKKE